MGNGVLNAIEFRKFTPFGTIKQRVQIGLEYGGGVGQFQGDFEERYHYTDVTFQGGRAIGRQRTDVTTLLPEEFSPLGTMMPVGRLELAVAGIVIPAVKLRASGGIGFPANSSFTLTGVYLIGAR